MVSFLWFRRCNGWSIAPVSRQSEIVFFSPGEKVLSTIPLLEQASKHESIMSVYDQLHRKKSDWLFVRFGAGMLATVESRGGKLTRCMYVLGSETLYWNKCTGRGPWCLTGAHREGAQSAQRAVDPVERGKHRTKVFRGGGFGKVKSQQAVVRQCVGVIVSEVGTSAFIHHTKLCVASLSKPVGSEESSSSPVRESSWQALTAR